MVRVQSLNQWISQGSGHPMRQRYNIVKDLWAKGFKILDGVNVIQKENISNEKEK